MYMYSASGGCDYIGHCMFNPDSSINPKVK